MTTKETIEQFEIVFEPDEGGFHVSCPALKGCHSFGASRTEARENIREAIIGWLEAAEKDGQAPPERELIRVSVG